MEPIQGNVSIDAQNIMPIIKKWLYSDKDIFIREVVSNGCDAITKLRMVDSAAAQGCSIHVEVDKAAPTAQAPLPEKEKPGEPPTPHVEA